MTAMRFLKTTLVLLAFVISTASFQIVSINKVYASGPAACYKKTGFMGMPTWYEYLDVGDKNGDPCAILGPTEKDAEGNDTFSLRLALPRIILAIVEILLRVAGMVSVGYIIFGGIKYTLSQGEPDGVEKAKKTVLNSLIGLAVAVLATAIVGLVGSALWK